MIFLEKMPKAKSRNLLTELSRVLSIWLSLLEDSQVDFFTFFVLKSFGKWFHAKKVMSHNCSFKSPVAGNSVQLVFWTTTPNFPHTKEQLKEHVVVSPVVAELIFIIGKIPLYLRMSKTTNNLQRR